MDNDNFLNFKIKAIRSLIAHILFLVFLGCFFVCFFQFHLTPFVHFLCPTDPSKCTKFNIKSQFNQNTVWKLIADHSVFSNISLYNESKYSLVFVQIWTNKNICTNLLFLFRNPSVSLPGSVSSYLGTLTVSRRVSPVYRGEVGNGFGQCHSNFCKEFSLIYKYKKAFYIS